MRISKVFFAGLFVFSIFNSAFGQVSYRVVAVSGQPAPDTAGSIYGTGLFGAVIDNNGRVSFKNVLVPNVGDATIFNYECLFGEGSDGMTHLFARKGQTIDENINFKFDGNSFNIIVRNDSGLTAFFANTFRTAPSQSRHGIWVGLTNSLPSYVAMAGEALPSIARKPELFGTHFEGVGLPTMSAVGDVAYAAVLTNENAVNAGNDELVMDSTGGGPYRVAAREGDPMPDPLPGPPVGANWGGNDGHNFSQPCLSGGATTFIGYTTGGGGGISDQAIFSETHTMASMRVVVGDDQAVPGLAQTLYGNLTYFDVNSDGNVAFLSDLAGPAVNPPDNGGALFAENGGAIYMVARNGENAPGGGRYDYIYPPHFSASGLVAYAAYLKNEGPVDNSNHYGVYLGSSQLDAVNVMRAGTPAPGLAGGYTFSPLVNLPSVNGHGQVCFNAGIAGGAPFNESDFDSIWATDTMGNLVLLAAKGQSFQVAAGDSRIISSCGQVQPFGSGGVDGQPFVFNDNGQAVFNLTFTNNTVALVVATIGGSACIPPSITQQPQAMQSVCHGGSVMLSVGAMGDAPLTYQWRRGATNLNNDAHIMNVDGPVLTIDPFGPGDVASDYNCVVTNGCDTETSTSASISLAAQTAFSQEPSDRHIVETEAAQFSVKVSGSGTPSFQWRKNGAPVANGANVFGAMTATLIINPAKTTDAGRYDVVVNSFCGILTSNAATLVVDPAPAAVATTSPLPPGSAVVPMIPPAPSPAPGDLCGSAGGSGLCGMGMMSMMPMMLAGLNRMRRRKGARRRSE